jgi:hypothetical protein
MAEKKVDVNTALFLLGTNWAAVDVFRSIHTLRSIHPDQPNYKVHFIKGMGSYGAAFTVVFWGTFQTILQASLTLLLLANDQSHLRRRFLMLILGLVLPLIALTATTFGPVTYGLGSGILDFFPALYWKGMGSDTHAILVTYAAGTGILIVAFFIIAFFIVVWSLLPLEHVMKSETVTGVLFLCGSSSLLLFSVSLILTVKSNVYLWGTLPFLLFFSPILLGAGVMMWIVNIPGSIVVYVFKAYLRLGSNVSESCFFMPCAPQSIKEEGQLYPLLVGLFSLFAFEILPPIFGELRQRYRENRLFVQDVQGRLRQFQMRRRTRAGSNL